MRHTFGWTGLVMGWLLIAGAVTDAQGQTAQRPGLGEYKRPVIGADISWVPSQEDRGVKFRDEGVEKDVLKILAEHKFNWIRLRLFVDPTAENGYSKQGYCGLEQTLTMAKRIKAAGMSFLLDFHYSDTWADPGKQFTPASWQGLSDEALVEKMHDYTRDVLKRFVEEGAAPEMVQIGNEIHNGFVWPQGKLSAGRETFGGLLRRASEAVREVDPKIKIMVHPALGGDNKRSVWFFDLVLSQNVVFDVIGQSYYPEHHGTLEALRTNLTDLATRYRKPIVVVEYNERAKEVNEIVRDLPDGLGWGTFIWEATTPRWGGLFDRNGATTQKIDIYPEFFQTVATSVAASLPVSSTETASRVIEDGGTGPYKAIMASDSSLATHTIFRPKDLGAVGGEKKLPIIAWGNGACANSPWEHVNFLSEVASRGFLVVAIGKMPVEGQRGGAGGPTKSPLMLDAIRWALEQNNDKSGPYYQKLDTNKIAVAGMSCGGLQALEVAPDPRVSTVIVCNSGLFNEPGSSRFELPRVGKDHLAKLHTPTLYMLGGEKDIAYKNGMDDFRRINHVPVFAANLNVGHGGTYARRHGGEFGKVATAWLLWQLKGDQEAGRMFTGEPCGLAGVEGWLVEKKNIP